MNKRIQKKHRDQLLDALGFPRDCKVELSGHRQINVYAPGIIYSDDLDHNTLRWRCIGPNLVVWEPGDLTCPALRKFLAEKRGDNGTLRILESVMAGFTRFADREADPKS